MLLGATDVQQVSNAMMNMLHDEEIAIVNDFHAAVTAGEVGRIDELFKVLLYDVEDHFSTEEEMMEESKFYAAAIHKSEHDSMRKKLDNLHQQWQHDKKPKAIRKFLEEEFKQWLMLHIARWDAETAMHLGDSM